MLYVSMPVRSMDCEIPYPSNITNSWNAGIAITQTTISICQFFLGFASCLTDGYFFYYYSNNRIDELEAELEKLRKDHNELWNEENLLIIQILQKLYLYIDKNPSADSREQMIVIIRELSAEFRRMAGE